MAIGPAVRRLFGRYERDVASAYRGFFINLHDLAALVVRWAPRSTRILEVGCGEGAMTELLVRSFPNARIVALDPSPNVGRLFKGSRDNVEFFVGEIGSYVRQNPERFDLVIVIDVLHHVPIANRKELLGTARASLSPGGCIIVKDWLASWTLAHGLCAFSDRFLTGDQVSYYDDDGLTKLILSTCGENSIRETETVSPRANNKAYLVVPA